ncbi:MAG: N6 adenine-specific DNA methyltransferase, N12 class [uncultured Acidimicrobiales bacterium]|uniref:N6 adenine-specific DNA methyltransferase, N12 class n=1 Tax=uncultured Acidimicrobiales bacterium TaxID=310071 RepID=A0A6J4JAB4_9ACTN|nr:MAG: N6 adenine-specific DNA methyltransferase, N12 class [uncultured Acidimicrobiales bacterium]
MVLSALPPACREGLDVGCGEGMLTRELAERMDHVVGIDLDQASIDLARAQGTAGVEYVVGDFMTHPFEPESFDAIVSVAALHHMEPGAALARMRRLLRPGGRLAVVGLARSRPADLPLDAAGLLADQYYKRTRAYWDHSAPTVWPPPHTYGQVRQLAGRELPGVRYRRHLLFRYSLVWTKPPAR